MWFTILLRGKLNTNQTMHIDDNLLSVSGATRAIEDNYDNLDSAD